MNFTAENEEEEEKLFMAFMDTNPKKGDLWFVDNGCSNHMTGTKSLFKKLDETQKKLRCNLEIQKRCKLKEKVPWKSKPVW